MKLGMVGAGNMGSAILRGTLQAGTLASDLMVYDANQEKMGSMAKELGIAAAASARDLTSQCDLIFLAVKPDVIGSVIREIAPLADGKVLVSMAAGWSLGLLEKQGGGVPLKLVRIMPNTPAMVNEAMTAVCANSLVKAEELDQVVQIMGGIGKVERVSEKLMDAVGGVSGASPAYVYLFIEAMADGAVLLGMPRQQAYTFAAQAVLGAAKMALETGMHPGALKDMVCSPGGSTIEGVRVLEEQGMRSAVMGAVIAAAEKTAKMEKENGA